MSATVDFAAPTEFGRHHFYVEIPTAPREAILIHEDYGFDGDEGRRETSECRVILARELWNKIRDDARRDFNTRLKAKKQSTGTWNTGKVKLDRFLGRELCILAWAAEHATTQECAIICQKWLALRPEERLVVSWAPIFTGYLVEAREGARGLDMPLWLQSSWQGLHLQRGCG